MYRSRKRNKDQRTYTEVDMWCPPVQDATRGVPSLAYNNIKALRIPSAICEATTVFLCPARQWFKKVDFYPGLTTVSDKRVKV